MLTCTPAQSLTHCPQWLNCTYCEECLIEVNELQVGNESVFPLPVLKQNWGGGEQKKKEEEKETIKTFSSELRVNSTHTYTHTNLRCHC